QLYGKNALLGIHHNHIAIAEQGHWAAHIRFRANVPYAEATRTATKSAIGNQGNILAQVLAIQRGGNGKHFPHTGAALGAFIANDYGVTGHDLLVLNSGKGGLFPVKDFSRAAMHATSQAS